MEANKVVEEIFYKLTSQYAYTLNNTKWEIGKRNRVKFARESPQLCTVDVLHCYRSPELGLILNQGSFFPPRLWEIKSGPVVASDWGKIGTFWQEPIKELD